MNLFYTLFKKVASSCAPANSKGKPGSNKACI